MKNYNKEMKNKMKRMKNKMKRELMTSLIQLMKMKMMIFLNTQIKKIKNYIKLFNFPVLDC